MVQIIEEGKVEDLEAGFPLLAEKGVVKFLAEKDPTPQKKYLNWSVRWMNKIAEEEPDDQTLLYFSRRFASLIIHYNSLLPYTGDKNDISKIKGIEELEAVVVAANERKQEVESKKQKKSEASSQAEKESSLVLDNDYFRVVRPYSEHAACHYGQGAKWCISATRSENYFNKYTFDEDKVFYIVDAKALVRSGVDTEFNKFVFELDEDNGRFETVWSETNNSWDIQEAFDQIAIDLIDDDYEEDDYEEDDFVDEEEARRLRTDREKETYRLMLDLRSAWDNMCETILQHFQDTERFGGYENPDGEILFKEIFKKHENKLEEMLHYDLDYDYDDYGDDGEGSISLSIGITFNFNNFLTTINQSKHGYNDSDSVELNPQLFSSVGFLDALEDAIRSTYAWGYMSDFLGLHNVEHMSQDGDDYQFLLSKQNNLILNEIFYCSGAFELNRDGAFELNRFLEDLIDMDENLDENVDDLIRQLGWSAKGDYDPNNWEEGGIQDESVGGKEGKAEYPFFVVKGFHKKDYFPGGPDAMKNQLELPLREFFKRWKF